LIGVDETFMTMVNSIMVTRGC